jgi:hypothetical protein
MYRRALGLNLWWGYLEEMIKVQRSIVSNYSKINN